MRSLWRFRLGIHVMRGEVIDIGIVGDVLQVLSGDSDDILIKRLELIVFIGKIRIDPVGSIEVVFKAAVKRRIVHPKGDNEDVTSG